MRRLAVSLCLLALLGGCTNATPAPKKQAAVDLEPGEISPATPATFRTAMRSMRGKPVVVNFWASWCVPCADEMPRLVEAARRYDGQVRFLGVDVEDHSEEAAKFADRYDLNFPSVADPRGEIRRGEKVVGLPTTQFYRADGQLAFLHSGEISEEQLEKRIRELLRIGTPARTRPPGASASPS